MGLRGEGLKGEVAKFNEILSATLDRVNEAKEELEDQRAKASGSCDAHVSIMSCDNMWEVLLLY